jgi:hypothetical protein
VARGEKTVADSAEDAINRAMVSCGQSGTAPENHFAGAGKMVKLLFEVVRRENGRCNLARR